MALREIQPLNDKDWNTLVDDLDKGQTPEQAETLRKALENTDKIPTVEY